MPKAVVVASVGAALVLALVAGCGGDEPSPTNVSSGTGPSTPGDPPPGADGGTSSEGGVVDGGACGNGGVDGMELCDGPPVACTTLGAVWASGQAACRADCSGYDVSSCTLGSQTTEAVVPKLRTANHDNALCNDGSPFSFDVSLVAGSKKWVVYLEGGGACDPVYGGCGARGVDLTSSKNRPADRAPGATSAIPTFLGRDPVMNPDFYDANIAFGQYCSSDGWTGTNTTPQTVKAKGGNAQWVFTGRHNARAFIETLFRAYGLDDGKSEVLFAGNSAGGMGANFNVDLIASRMPKAIAEGRIAVLSGAAWQNTLWDDPNFTSHGSGESDAQVGAKISAAYQSAGDPKCPAIAASKGAPVTACVGGPFTYAAASRPSPTGWGIRTFVAKNRLDQGEMKEHGIPLADTSSAIAQAARETWGQQMTASMKDVTWLYAPLDPQENADEENLHGLVTDPLVWTYEPPGHPGQSLRAMISRFWKAKPGDAGERLLFEGSVPHEGESGQ